MVPMFKNMIKTRNLDKHFDASFPANSDQVYRDEQYFLEK